MEVAPKMVLQHLAGGDIHQINVGPHACRHGLAVRGERDPIRGELHPARAGSFKARSFLSSGEVAELE